MKEAPALKNIPSRDSLSVPQIAKQYHINDSLNHIARSDSVIQGKSFHWSDLKSYREVMDPKQDSVPYSASVFTKHRLQTKEIQPQNFASDNNSLFIIALTVILLILALVRQSNIRRFNDVIKAFIVPRIANQVMREESSFTNRTSLALVLVFVLSGGLFLYQLAGYFGFYPLLALGAASYFVFCAAIVLIYFIKIMSLRLLAYVFRTEALFSEYVFLVVLFNQVLGLVLIPVVACFAFAHGFAWRYVVYFGMGVIISMFVYRLIRGTILVVSRPNVSGFYLFLYLCTLEFLPMALLVKAFMLVFNKQ